MTTTTPTTDETADFADLLAGDEPGSLLALPAPGEHGPRLRSVPPPDPDADDPDHDADDDGDDDGDGPGDRESVITGTVLSGVPVDPPDEPSPAWRTVRRDRAPVVPPAIASRRAIAGTVRWMAGEVRYHAGFHGIRAPKYAVKALAYAPVGVARTTGRLLRWASAEHGNWELRQAAAGRGDADTWLKLDARRQRQARWRWPVVITALALSAAGAAVLIAAPMPGLVRAAGLIGAVLLLARAGRPADKPITDRVSHATAYRKLTAELVRRALMNVQLAAINSAVAKDPNAISFPVEIHRDGPGHLAIVDLPYGVEAADVIARRGKLASGLRLPLDQVWPEPAPGHTGRLALWVGHEPASQMRQPAWPLLRDGEVDIFKPFPFATTPRLDIVNASLPSRNWLFGGQPGSGKSFALRIPVLAACLDPRCEIRGYELKGVGDFKPIAPVCAEYGNGQDDDTIARCAAMFGWLYGEGQRRAKRIEHYAAIGKAPENKVTPELASLPGSGLNPLVVFVDEIQELFSFGKTGREAGEIAVKCVKLFRALGIWILIGTQIPDKDSLPTGITRNINTRFCLSVADQVANDMILGTSAYKLGYRATVFEPETDAGWGILAGIGKPGPRRSFYVDNHQAETVMARAIAARAAAGTLPETTARELPAFDLLADVAAIWPAGEDAAWNETLLERLTQLRPDHYSRWEPAQLTTALAGYGITTGQIGRRINGKTVNRRGPNRADIRHAITERNHNRSDS
jgi:DNA segregation ATPase FtsK/SpoIIIE, S-DNA-T family